MAPEAVTMPIDDLERDVRRLERELEERVPDRDPLDPMRPKHRKDLARWLHREYEEIAADVGWQTQDGTSVPFEDLPPENREVMVQLAERILGAYEVRLDE